MVSERFPVESGALPVGFAAGSQIAGYKLEQQIGSGGMAVVFRARDERLGRRVALKILAPALSADEEFRRRFIRESRAAAAVDDPHIIPVFEAGEAAGALFIAMRYVAGGDVLTLVHRLGPLPAERAMAILSPVASALDTAHGAGLVHRDVKPANMLLDVRPGRPDHVYLSDFGLSKGVLTARGLTMSGQWLGTPGYSAPEQMEGNPVDGRADQYSLACAAFEVLCGEPPFQRDHVTALIWAHMSQPPPRLTFRRPDLPRGVDEVLVTALAKAPGQRYASCREFADALRQELGLAPYDSGSASIPPPVDPHAGKALSAPLDAPGQNIRVTETANRRPTQAMAPTAMPPGTAASQRPARPEAHQGHASQDAPPAPSSYPAPGVLRSHAATATNLKPVARPGPGEMPPYASNLKRRTGQGMTAHRPRRSRIRALPVVLSLAAAAAVAGALIGAIMTRSPVSQPRTVKPQLTAYYAFPPQRYRNGLLIARRWTLSGRQGSQLTETITARSASGKPIVAWFQDNIPASITTTVHAVHFRPDPARIVHADPVVEWRLHLPAHGTVTVGYVTTVPPKGATTARLATWAKGLDAIEEHLNTPAARHPRPARASASPTATPSVVTPTANPSPTPSGGNCDGNGCGNGGGGNVGSPAAPASGGNGGGGNGGNGGGNTGTPTGSPTAPASNGGGGQ